MTEDGFDRWMREDGMSAEQVAAARAEDAPSEGGPMSATDSSEIDELTREGIAMNRPRNGPRHPEITVKLTGTDGNAFALLGNVSRALQHAGCDDAEVAQFMGEATEGYFEHLLVTCLRWVDVS